MAAQTVTEANYNAAMQASEGRHFKHTTEPPWKDGTSHTYISFADTHPLLQNATCAPALRQLLLQPPNPLHIHLYWDKPPNAWSLQGGHLTFRTGNLWTAIPDGPQYMQYKIYGRSTAPWHAATPADLNAPLNVLVDHAWGNVVDQAVGFIHNNIQRFSANGRPLIENLLPPNSGPFPENQVGNRTVYTVNYGTWNETNGTLHNIGADLRQALGALVQELRLIANDFWPATAAGPGWQQFPWKQ